MKTVGIIGGSTDLATAEYYKLINAHIRAKLGGFNTGEIIINSMNFERSAHFVTNDLWDEGAEYLHGKALSLERAGADFIICVSNTWHKVSEAFMKDIKIPSITSSTPRLSQFWIKTYKLSPCWELKPLWRQRTCPTNSLPASE